MNGAVSEPFRAFVLAPGRQVRLPKAEARSLYLNGLIKI
jgi:hypothetical protein